MQLQMSVLLFLSLIPAWLISAAVLYGTGPPAKEDMVVGFKPAACWLYPDSTTVLKMECASLRAEVHGTTFYGNGVCWPVTKQHLIEKGFTRFPDSAFTGTFNRGVLCPKDLGTGNVNQYKQAEAINPNCDGQPEDGSPTYHWFGYDNMPWWFGCTFKKN